MSADFCVMNVTGRVGRNAEVKSVGKDTVIEFSIANGQYVGKGKGYNGGAYDTHWVNCVIWMKDAADAHETAGKILKGAEIAANGEYTMEVWKDRDGTARNAMKLRLSSRGGFKILRSGAGESEPAPRSNEPVRGTQQTPPRAPANNHDDVIPF